MSPRLNTLSIPTVTSPVLLQTEHDVWNPTGKVPTLVLNEKRPIFGSQAINQYIDIKAPAGKKLLPTDETRADELTLEALADGILDACLSVRYEISTRVGPQKTSKTRNPY